MLEVLDDEALRRLTHAERLGYLVEQDRIIAAAQAEQLRVLALMDADPPVSALPEYRDKGWLHEEVACALRVAPSTAARRLGEAAVSVRLPGVLAGLSTGYLSAYHVQALTRGVLGLDAELAAAVAAQVLPDAPEQNYGAFCRSLERAMLNLAPAVEDDRRELALSERRVTFRPELPGTTSMYAVLPDEDAAAIRTLLRQAAAAAETTGDTRTVEQRQGDSLVDLLLRADCGSGPSNTQVYGPVLRHPLIQVSVALSTLLGLDEQPRDLAGVGPIPAELARRLADDPTGTWRRLITDPTGQLIDYGRTRYRPPAALADYVTARDRTCRFPGCAHRADTAEIDHRIAWAAGGTTNAGNLQVLCPRHHHLKDESRWEVRALDNRTTDWTSPAGAHYTTPPPEPYPVDATPSARSTLAVRVQDAESDPDPPPF